MSTLRTYSYAMNKEQSRRKGIQTLRGSHDIIPGEPVKVGHERQLLMDWHVVDDLNGCYRTVHQPDKHPDNPLLRPEHPYEGTRLASFGTVIREPDTGQFRLWVPSYDQTQFKQEGKTLATMRGHYYE